MSTLMVGTQQYAKLKQGYMSGINIRDIKWGPQVPCHPLTNKDMDDWERDVLLQRNRGAHAYIDLQT